MQKSEVEGVNLSDVSRALDVLGSHGCAKAAGDGKGPPRDGEDGTVAKEGRELVRFQGGRHDHHFERDGAPPGGLVRVGEELLQEAQEDVLQQVQWSDDSVKELAQVNQNVCIPAASVQKNDDIIIWNNNNIRQGWSWIHFSEPEWQ